MGYACARSTPPSTGRPGRCPSRGWSTPPSTSRRSSSCARRSAPSSRRPARPSGRARSSQHLVDRGARRPRQDPWRRTSGMHRARGRRALAAVRELWQARDEIAQRRDVTPGRIIPDSAIVEAANAMPRDTAALLGLQGLPRPRCRALRRTSGSRRCAPARRCPTTELPPLAARYDGPPPPRAWADRDPVAAARLATARDGAQGAAPRSTTSRSRTCSRPTSSAG